jgi:hypothetical protein
VIAVAISILGVWVHLDVALYAAFCHLSYSHL